MCLGIPAQISQILDPELGTALAQTQGVGREVNVGMLAQTQEQMHSLLGKWVLVHVGFAMAVIDEQEAHASLALITQAQEAYLE